MKAFNSLSLAYQTVIIMLLFLSHLAKIYLNGILYFMSWLSFKFHFSFLIVSGLHAIILLCICALLCVFVCASLSFFIPNVCLIVPSEQNKVDDSPFNYNQYASIDPEYKDPHCTDDSIDMLDGGFEQQAPDLRFRQLQGRINTITKKFLKHHFFHFSHSNPLFYRRTRKSPEENLHKMGQLPLIQSPRKNRRFIHRSPRWSKFNCPPRSPIRRKIT